jgi:hypothetical protein
VPRDGDLSFAADPNVMTAAAADETPAEGPKAALELPALHEANIHISV